MYHFEARIYQTQSGCSCYGALYAGEAHDVNDDPEMTAHIWVTRRESESDHRMIMRSVRRVSGEIAENFAMLPFGEPHVEI